MLKENVHSVMDSPKFLHWKSQNGRELFSAPIKLKRGSLGAFIEKLRTYQKTNRPYFLEFFSPAGLTLTAEVAGFELPED